MCKRKAFLEISKIVLTFPFLICAKQARLTLCQFLFVKQFPILLQHPSITSWSSSVSGDLVPVTRGYSPNLSNELWYTVMIRWLCIPFIFGGNSKTYPTPSLLYILKPLYSCHCPGWAQTDIFQIKHFGLEDPKIIWSAIMKAHPYLFCYASSI